MAIIIGTENISTTQRNLLQHYNSTRLSRELAQVLLQVVRDSDIVDGHENLHPDWLSIFKRHREQLEAAKGQIGWPRFEDLRQAFDALEPIDSLIDTIHPKEEQIAFLLGAGASKPSPSGIPTVKELLPELLRRARRLDQEQVTSLADFCDRQHIDNIEDLLTAVQISAFCSRNPGILSLVEFQLFSHDSPNSLQRRAMRGLMRTDVSSVAYLQDTLQVLFGLLSNLMLPASPNEGHRAIVDYLRDKPHTPIVTTNYDCCIDRALISNSIPFTYTVDFDNPHVLPSPSDADASLIKLHGSLNWFYCETCQKVRLIDIEQTVENYIHQRGEYPIISVCNECGGQRRGLLVPPHAMKFDVAPPLQSLIATAASCFERSSLIVVIGFSFADADLYISRMLIKAMQASTKTKLMIIDPDPGVTEKVRRKFEAQIPDFNSRERILTIEGDCSEVLPQFLRGGLLKAPLNGVSEPLADQEEIASAGSL